MYNPIKRVQHTRTMNDCMTTEYTELQKVKENTLVTQNDLKFERDLSENDNKFEITILKNQQLEVKTIII